MLDIKIEENSRGVVQLQRQLPDRFVVPASLQALNRTLTNSRAEVTRRIRGRVNLKARAIRDSMSQNRATRSRIEASLDFRFRPISLKEYGARQVRRGVRVTVMRGRREQLRGLFIQDRMGSHVFGREPQQRQRPLSGRSGKERWYGLPVQKKFGPTVQSQAKEVLPGMRGYVSDRMLENMRQASNRYLARVQKGGRR